MLELTVDVLDPGVSRFQLYLAILIAMMAIFITVLKSLLAERQAARRKKVLAEMREYKEKVRQEEAVRREKDMKKWEEGEDWPTGGEEEDEGGDGDGEK